MSIGFLAEGQDIVSVFLPDSDLIAPVGGKAASSLFIIKYHGEIVKREAGIRLAMAVKGWYNASSVILYEDNEGEIP